MASNSPRSNDRVLLWLVVPAATAVVAVVVVLAVVMLGRERPPVEPSAAPATTAAPPSQAPAPTPAADGPEEPASEPSDNTPATAPTQGEPAQPQAESTAAAAADLAAASPQGDRSASRSPFPRPGETITEPLPPVRLADAESRLASAPEDVISWRNAPKYVGQRVTVEGTIVRAHDTGAVCFLNFVEDYRGRFYIILFKSALSGWPQPPEQYFPGKTIRVTGEVRLHNNTPQIQVRTPEQIQIVASE